MNDLKGRKIKHKETGEVSIITRIKQQDLGNNESRINAHFSALNDEGKIEQDSMEGTIEVDLLTKMFDFVN